MFEIQSASFANTRQQTAARKAMTERPAVTQKTPDTFEVWSTSYRYNGNDSYNVRFLRSDDKLFVRCTCEAGKNGHPCYHAMAAYQQVYSQQLTTTGARLLGRQTVGTLGFVGPAVNPNSKIFNLLSGQTFTATAPVKLTVEPSS